MNEELLTEPTPEEPVQPDPVPEEPTPEEPVPETPTGSGVYRSDIKAATEEHSGRSGDELEELLFQLANKGYSPKQIEMFFDLAPFLYFYILKVPS